MEYRVISAFNDILDSGFLYSVGDAYPRQGTQATDERIAELSGSNNKQHKPLIEAVVVQAEKDEEIIVPARRKRGRKNEND